MNSLYNKLILIVALITCCQAAKSQDYIMAGGIRTLSSPALTFKGFVMENNAMELIWSFRNDGMQWTGLYEMHSNALENRTNGFHWFYGFGPHIGYNRGYACENCLLVDTITTDKGHIITETKDIPKRAYLSLGMDVILGLEYRFVSLPLTAGIEYKPSIEFFNRRKFNNDFGNIALSIKYTFKK